MSSYNTKNYQEQGGDVWRIGGKLIIEDGAELEGFPAAANVPASTASDVAGVVTDLNAVIAALKAAGLMAADSTS